MIAGSMIPRAGEQRPPLAGMPSAFEPSPASAFRSAPGSPVAEPALPPYDNFVLRSWQGREPLWKVFWIYGILAGLGLALVLNMLLVIGLPRFLMFAIVAPYQVWLVVSTWRCALNTGWPGWGYMARTLIIAGVAVAILALSARTTLGF